MLASGSVHLGLLALLALSWTAAKDPVSLTEISFVERSATPPIASSVHSSPRRALARSRTPTEASTVAADTAEHPNIDFTEDSGALETYESEVARMLDARKHYPEVARRLRQQGRVKVAFEIDRQGYILSVDVVEQSPFAILNEAAHKLVAEIKQFKAFPENVKAAVWRFTVPIEYKM